MLLNKRGPFDWLDFGSPFLFPFDYCFQFAFRRTLLDSVPSTPDTLNSHFRSFKREKKNNFSIVFYT